MTDPRWIEGYSNAAGQLFEFWQYRATVGAAFAVICDAMGMEKALVYLMFCTLTLDMVVRVWVLIHRHRSVCRGMKQGLPRYIQYLAFITLAWFAQLALELSTSIKLPVIDLVMAWLVWTDLGSIIGHLHFMGWHIPAPIVFIVNGGKRNVWNRVRSAFPDEPLPDAFDSLSARRRFVKKQQSGIDLDSPREPYTPAEHPCRRADDDMDAESCAASGPPDADCPHRRDG